MKSGNLRGDERITDLIQTASARTTKHLQQLIRPYMTLEISRLIMRAGHQYRAHGKVDPGSQSHGSNHHSELSFLSQRFNDSGSNRVAQSAVMKCYSRSEQSRERFTG